MLFVNTVLVTLASYIFANVLTVKFVMLPVAALMVVTLVVERLEVPETFRPVRIPTDVILGWAG